MSYKIATTPQFDRELKKLSKKHRSIKADVAALGEKLENNPFIGDELTENCYKIRMAITSKGKGKSGGARGITYIKIEGATVVLLYIYDKSEQSDISDKELLQLLKEVK